MTYPRSRPYSFISISVVAILGFLFAEDSAVAQPGPASAFSFLRLEPSARAASLGGSFSAVYGDDVNALFYNPALLNEDMHGALSLSYLNHLGGVNAGFAAHARHVERIGGTLAAGLRYVSWGDMTGYDESGEETGEFGASSSAVTISYARADGSPLRIGAGVHAVFSRIESFGASAVAADAGLAYHLPEPQLTLSASINNLGIVTASLGDVEDELPVDVRIGVAKRLRYVPLMLSITGYNLNRLGEEPFDGNAVGEAMRHVAFGGEFLFSEAFQVRLGYNHRRHQDLKMKSRLDLAGFAAGFGIKVSLIRFDYAFNSWSTLGGLHQFTIRTVI